MEKYIQSKNGKTHRCEQPHRRQWDDDPHNDFVAIDFETATYLRTSACALGMVKVIDGEIVQKYYTIINPVRDEYTDSEPNLDIHSIPLHVCEKCDTFIEIYSLIENFIRGFRIVCHNKGADISILEQTMSFYGIKGTELDLDNVFCTYQATKKKLSVCCEEMGIPLDNHHDALADAEACAKIYLHLLGKPYVEKKTSERKLINKKDQFAYTIIAKEKKVRLSDEDIVNRDTIFYNATVVITGVFEQFPVRELLAEKIQKLGAKISASISKKTTIVVMGNNAGPKKIETINNLKLEGHNIVTIEEFDLLKIFESIG